MKLEPWQAELLIKLEEGVTLTSTPRRQSGKDWYNLFQQFMRDKPEKRFQLASAPGDSGYLLMIVDYMWWTENEREILNWMEENLPNGIDHQQGMVLTFDTDKQRMMFLLRWA